MTGQQTCWAACLGSLVTIAACVPVEDLSGYSSPATGADSAGSNSAESVGPGGSGGSPGTSASAGAGPIEPSGEAAGGALSLDPSSTAGGAGASGDESGTAPLPEARSADAGSCDGANEFGSADGQSCYRHATDTVTWPAARAACIAWGGDLVSIESAGEDDLLTARLSVDVWIGVNDRDIEGTMVWADGSPLVYENWADAQPDDFNAEEDCGEKRVSAAGGWNDGPCDGTPRAFLCER